MSATDGSIEIAPLAQPPHATVALPGSKSITNRALVCAALAFGTSTITNPLRADDTAAMVRGITALGATVEEVAGAWEIGGTGGAPQVVASKVDVGQAGTVARFLPPVAAVTGGEIRFDGDPQIRARPMGALLDALRALGAGIDPPDASRLPFTVKDGDAIRGGEVRLPGDVSSQFLSGLMMAAPLTRDGMTIELTTDLVSRPFVEMTAAVMSDFGARAEVGRTRVTVAPGRYAARELTVEPDASTASYFFALAAATGGTVSVPGIGGASRQGDLRLVWLLEQMGADVDVSDDVVTVAGTGTLRGITADLRDISDMVPTLAVVAALASGPTTIEGVGFIRAKESDRVGDLATELRRFGAAVEERPDGLVVVPGPLRRATIDPHGDHRLAMAFTVLGLAGPGAVITQPEVVSKTFPGFFATVEQLR